jgi:hypothetical protein
MESPSLSVIQSINSVKLPGVHAPGIYFGLTMQEYLDDRSFNSSLIVARLISKLKCWSNSWMNPEHEREETDAQENGTAFHTRLLDGQAVFDEKYGIAISKDDYPEAVGVGDKEKGITPGDQLKMKCGEMGLPVSGTIAALSSRLKLAGCVEPIWYFIEQEYLKKMEGKILLPRKQIARINAACAAIEKNPENMQWFRGGHQEVSIFYTHPVYGVPMKNRLDYLALRHLTEVKTFANMMNKNVITAVGKTIEDNQYLIKAGFYADSLEIVKQMLREGKAGIYGPDDQMDALRGFVAEMVKTDAHRYIWLFQESGKTPHLDLVEYCKEVEGTSTIYSSLASEFAETGIRQIAEALLEHGIHEPWNDPVVLRPLLDDDLPPWTFGGALKIMRDSLR